MVVVLDSVLRAVFFTFFTQSSNDLGDFANSAYNLAVHVSTITVCMIFPFAALGAIASAAIDRHREDAERDPLTGLLNRRGFENAIKRGRNGQPMSGSLMVFDIDHFKRINDTHGHALGDQVIVALATVLEEGAGALGHVARTGGEEFVAFLPATSSEEAQAFANLIRLWFRDRDWSLLGIDHTVTVSAGISSILAEQWAVEHAFVRADAALYAAKSAGRDRVRQANSKGTPEWTSLSNMPCRALHKPECPA